MNRVTRWFGALLATTASTTTVAVTTVALTVAASACDKAESAADSTLIGDTLPPVTEPAGTPADTTTTSTSTTTPPTTTTTTTTTTSSTSTSTSSTSSTSSTTSTTTQEQADEALRQQIAADYVENRLEADALVANPTLDDLPDRVAEFILPGSPAFSVQVSFVEELVAMGDVVIRNDPDLFLITVESVELLGTPPYTSALVVACEVDNRKRVTPAGNSPTGEVVEVLGTGALTVTRYREPLQLSDRGWVQFESPRDATGFEDVEVCPSS